MFVYNRPKHTEQALIALKSNDLAELSTLYIFSDGPKPNATEEQVNEILKVREIIKKEKWCGNVHINYTEKNIGCRDSILNGISKIIGKYENVIVLEDDIITSPWFLTYMNSALNFYESRKSVFSISGWNFPKSVITIPDDYQYDVYISRRILSWGWATWKDRWEQIDWNWDFVPEFIKDTNQTNSFNRGGEDLTSMLLDMYRKKIDAWDIQFVFAHFANHAISIIPCISYVNNIGLDGTGMHCAPDYSLYNNVEQAVKEPEFIPVLYEDIRITDPLYKLFSGHNQFSYGENSGKVNLLSLIKRKIRKLRKIFFEK